MIEITNKISAAWQRSLALMYQKIGSKDKAVSCLEKIIKEGSATAKDWWQCGCLYQKCNQWEKAHNAFLHAFKEEKGNPVYIYWLGKAEEQRGNDDTAFRLYTEVLKMDNSYYEAVVAKGQLALKNEKYQEALNCFIESLGKKCSESRILNDMGLCYLGLKENNKAVACFNEAVKLDPRERAYQYNLAWALAKAGDYDKAIEWLLKLDINNNPEIIEALAFCYGSIEKYDLCIMYYKEALILSPDNKEILRSLSSAYAKSGHYEEALQIIKEQLGKNQKDIELLNNLAWIYERISRYHDAEENYHRCLALSPEDPNILHNLICCLQNQNKHHEAIEMAEVLKGIPCGYKTAMAKLARSYESLGCGSIAVEYYNKALGLE